MDIHLLKTFIAAYEEANFTKAARRLNATQPGVSVQIATLEASICGSLFERNARSVTPTVAGRRLYPRALQLVHDFNATTQEIRALAGASGGRVAVGIPPVLSRAVLPQVLTRYLTTFAQTDVRIVELHGDALLALIDSGRLDAALVTQPADQGALAERRVCSDRLVLASGALSGADPTRPVPLDAEPRLKIVVPSLLRQTLDRVLDEPLRPRRIVPERIIEMDGLACILEFVARTDWVAVLPSCAIHQQPRNSGVRFSPIAGNDITIEYLVMHARTEPPSLAAQAFIDLMAAELRRVVAKWRPRSAAKPSRHHRLRRASVLSSQSERSSLEARDSRSFGHAGTAQCSLDIVGE